MSLPRYAQRRDATEAPIIRALESIGCQVEQLGQPCDLLVKWRGAIHLLEVEGGKRTGTGARRPAQLEFLAQWQVPIVKTIDEAFRAIGASKYIAG